MKAAYLAASFVVLLTSTALGNTYTVKLDGTGDFTDLQLAIDSVPVGSTVIVYGESGFSGGYPAMWSGIHIWSSVSLVGVSGLEGPPWLIFAGGGVGKPLYPPLAVSVGSTDVVCLSNFTIGYGNVGPDDNPISAITTSSGTLILDRCNVMGVAQTSGWGPFGGPTPPPNGIEVGGGAALVVMHSTVSGATTDTRYGYGDDGNGSTYVYGDEGGTGMVSGGGGVNLLLDSVVSGSSGGNVDWNPEKSSAGGDFPPDVLDGGGAGNGITGDAYVSGCVLSGASGGSYQYDLTNWGIGSVGPDGVGIVGAETDLPNMLTITGNTTIGSLITLGGTGFSANGAALLFVSSGVGPPVHVRHGAWFLSWPFSLAGLVNTDSSGAFAVSGSLPIDQSLVGRIVALQAGDAQHLSEPEVFVIGE